MKRILIVGSGSREHAYRYCFKKSSTKTKLIFAPGNAGTSLCGENINIKANDIQGLLNYVENYPVDLTFVGPEEPLVLGIVDLFQSHGHVIIGPNKKAAQLEGSKKWAKALMKRYNIPTASYEIFTDYEQAKTYASQQPLPLVIKADGLAAGKGVTIAHSYEEANQALKACLIDHHFKQAGSEVVIESYLRVKKLHYLLLQIHIQFYLCYPHKTTKPLEMEIRVQILEVWEPTALHFNQ